MALLYSYGFVFLVIAIATLLLKYNILKDEGARKLIHIGVGNWILVTNLVFDNMYLAIIPPFTFILINYISYRYGLFAAMERDKQSSSDLGTVYYAISLFIVVVLDVLLVGEITYAIVPVLILAYGDGLNSIIGRRFASPILIGNKTLLGSMTMFLIAGIIAIVMGYGIGVILFIAFIATWVELLTPKGFDNLSVPLVLYLFVFLIEVL